MGYFTRLPANQGKSCIISSLYLSHDMTHDMAWSSRQLYPTPCNPMDCIPPGSSLHGIFQAKTLEWVAISYSRGSLNPSLLRLLHWAGGFFISMPPRKPFIPLEVPKQVVLWSSSHNSQIQQALKTESVIKSWILKHIQRQSLNWNKNFKNHSLTPPPPCECSYISLQKW